MCPGTDSRVQTLPATVDIYYLIRHCDRHPVISPPGSRAHFMIDILYLVTNRHSLWRQLRRNICVFSPSRVIMCDKILQSTQLHISSHGEGDDGTIFDVHVDGTGCVSKKYWRDFECLKQYIALSTLSPVCCLSVACCIWHYDLVPWSRSSGAPAHGAVATWNLNRNTLYNVWSHSYRVLQKRVGGSVECGGCAAQCASGWGNLCGGNHT